MVQQNKLEQAKAKLQEVKSKVGERMKEREPRVKALKELGTKVEMAKHLSRKNR